MDVGDQALMRGLVTAFPSVRPGRSLSYDGRRPEPATKRVMGVPLPSAPPPPVRELCLVAFAGGEG